MMGTKLWNVMGSEGSQNQKIPSAEFSLYELREYLNSFIHGGQKWNRDGLWIWKGWLERDLDHFLEW